MTFSPPSPAKQVCLYQMMSDDGVTMDGFALAGDWTYVTDMEAAPLGSLPSGSWFGHWHLPADFPRQAWIVSVKFFCDGPRAGGGWNEVVVWVDPHGVAYRSANPPGAQNSDYHRDIDLFHRNFAGVPFMDKDETRYPVLFNRDPYDGQPGDLLLLELTNSQPMSWCGVGIGYLAAP